MKKPNKSIKTVEDYDFGLISTTNGFKAKQHFMKLIAVLRTVYEKKQVSKWDLATVNKKKGPKVQTLQNKKIIKI